MKLYEVDIRGYARQNGLEPALVAALILTESSGNPHAYRYEDGFYQRYLANQPSKHLGLVWDEGVTEESERRLRAFSFGLCQIMGQTAREYGFEGPLPELFNTSINIRLGCQILGSHLKHFRDLDLALSAYNSGRAYVNRHGVTPYAAKVRHQLANASKLITL